LKKRCVWNGFHGGIRHGAAFFREPRVRVATSPSGVEQSRPARLQAVIARAKRVRTRSMHDTGSAPFHRRSSPQPKKGFLIFFQRRCDLASPACRGGSAVDDRMPELPSDMWSDRHLAQLGNEFHAVVAAVGCQSQAPCRSGARGDEACRWRHAVRECPSGRSGSPSGYAR